MVLQSFLPFSSILLCYIVPQYQTVFMGFGCVSFTSREVQDVVHKFGLLLVAENLLVPGSFGFS